MSTVEVETDVVFAEVDGTALALDLYRPTGPAAPSGMTGPTAPPVVLYLHGGAWKEGDKSADAEHRLAALAAHGVAVASANYRLTAQARHPAQVHDAKAAVRYLRAHAGDHGLDGTRIGIWGASAGAYLASMVALSAHDPALEGDVGTDLGASSAVAAAVAWFGQSDLLSNSRRTWLERRLLAPPVEGPLLGLDDVGDDPAAAREASPIHRVSAEAPPFLIAHGDHDRVTPVSQSLALHDALVRVGARSTALLLGGAGHEGPEFDSPDHIALTAAFLRAHLAPGPGAAS